MKTQIIEHIINLWPENKSEKQKYLDEVWNMIETAYEPIGGCNCDKSELLDDNVYWKLSKRNGKIVCAFLYKLTKFGRKMFLLATDGTQQGGKDLRKIVEEDIKQLDRNFYTEVSGKPEYLYLNRGAQKIPASRARYILGPTKEITPSDDEYHYERKIGPSKVQHTKIMLGNPKAEESIQESFESNAYMIRDDGKYYPVTIHPYGSDDIEETAWAAEWLYNHTSNNDTKQKCLQLIKYWIEKIVCWDLDLSEPNVKEVSEYLDDIGYIVVTGKFVKEHWDDIMAQQTIDNPTNLNNEVNKLLNNEFLRFRYGGRLDTEKGSKEAVFRISSSGFNWFNIIWEFVYNHKNEIDSVTICKDLESTGKEDFYKHNGKEFNKMPVDEFITLNGRPIVETIVKGN